MVVNHFLFIVQFCPKAFLQSRKKAELNNFFQRRFIHPTPNLFRRKTEWTWGRGGGLLGPPHREGSLVSEGGERGEALLSAHWSQCPASASRQPPRPVAQGCLSVGSLELRAVEEGSWPSLGLGCLYLSRKWLEKARSALFCCRSE